MLIFNKSKRKIAELEPLKSTEVSEEEGTLLLKMYSDEVEEFTTDKKLQSQAQNIKAVDLDLVKCVNKLESKCERLEAEKEGLEKQLKVSKANNSELAKSNRDLEAKCEHLDAESERLPIVDEDEVDEDEVDENQSIEDLREIFETKFGKEVPVNKKNDFDWIESRIKD